MPSCSLSFPEVPMHMYAGLLLAHKLLLFVLKMLGTVSQSSPRGNCCALYLGLISLCLSKASSLLIGSYPPMEKFNVHG